MKTYPEGLAKVHWSSLAPKLVDWVPPGEARVAYLFTAAEACTEVELTRGRSAGTDDEPGPILLGGLRRELEKVDGGFRRELAEVRLGHLLLEPCGGGTETSADGKTWRKTGQIRGCGDPPTFRGVLSLVDEDVARWEALPQEITVLCAGPWTEAACRNGGRHPCDSCRTVAVSAYPRPPGTLTAGGATSVSEVGTLGQPVCDEPCPPTSNRDIARVRAIADRSHPWRLNADTAEPPASLYRSRGRCLREHRSAATAATMAAVNATPPEPARLEKFPVGVVLLGVNGFEAPAFARRSDPRLLSGTYLLDFEVPVAGGKRGLCRMKVSLAPGESYHFMAPRTATLSALHLTDYRDRDVGACEVEGGGAPGSGAAALAALRALTPRDDGLDFLRAGTLLGYTTGPDTVSITLTIPGQKQSPSCGSPSRDTSGAGASWRRSLAPSGAPSACGRTARARADRLSPCENRRLRRLPQPSAPAGEAAGVRRFPGALRRRPVGEPRPG